jgi:hypothetical protein
MVRHTLSVVTAAFLVAVVGAQGPKAPSAQEQGELYKKNRLVIEKVVDKTLESSRTPNNHVKRAESYYDVLFQFNKEIVSARQDNNQDRAADLTRNLGLLLEKGLAPTLVQARAQVEGGTGVPEFIRAREQLVAQLDALLQILGEDATAKASLDVAKKRLQDVRIPPK